MWAFLTANGCRILWRFGVGIALVALFYAAILKPFLKPNPTTTQNGKVNNNYTISVGMGGCARFPVVETPTQKVVKAVAPVVEAVKKAGK